LHAKDYLQYTETGTGSVRKREKGRERGRERKRKMVARKIVNSLDVAHSG